MYHFWQFFSEIPWCS
uniref:Uncharacterized protein n=1 Tax=Rhizophora mucronata TaxID=61149 RepID=A0A2P2QWJ2_RHIMU